MTLNAVLAEYFGVGFAIATQSGIAAQIASAVPLDRDGGLRLSSTDLDHSRGLHLDRPHADAADGARQICPCLG
jgi:hypothetical protein